jgi:hypothetical protein
MRPFSQNAQACKKKGKNALNGTCKMLEGGVNTKTLTLVRQLTGFAGNNDTAGPVAQLEVLNALRASLAEGEMSLPVGHRARRPRPRDG